MLPSRNCSILARESGRQSRAWGGARQRVTQEYGVRAHQAREAGDSFSLFTASSSLRLSRSLSPASRACAINAGRTWGSAALHPRLYSAARIRGLGFDTRVSSKNLGNDKALKSRARIKSRSAAGRLNFKKRSESKRTIRSNEGTYDYR
jgi:hypothetical protein